MAALTYIVGTYSPGNEFVVYEMSIQVFPTEPSPTTTHFISLSVFAIAAQGEARNREKKLFNGGVQILFRAHHYSINCYIYGPLTAVMLL